MKEKTSIGHYMADLKSADMQTMTKQEEAELFSSEPLGEAQEQLVINNLRYVISVAKKYMNKGLPLEDLINEGNIGLITAARKFDPTKNVKFISYATYWIRLAIQRAINGNMTIRLPQNQINDLIKVKKWITAGFSFEEAFSKAGFDLDDTKTKSRIYEQIYKTPLSLDFSYDADEEYGLANKLADTRINIESDMVQDETTTDIQSALAKLSDRYRSIIQDRFGMNEEGKEYTLDEIAKKLGVTKQRVAQLEKKAKKQLEEILTK